MAKMKKNKTESKKNESKSVDTSLKAVARKVKAVLMNGNRYNVDARYEAAVLLLKAVNKAKDGKKAITSLAVEMKMARQSVYRIVEVARAWSETEFKAIAKKVNKDNWPLTWSHFQLLAPVEADRRKDLVARALDEAMTVEEVTAAIKGKSSQNVTEPIESAPTESDVKIADDLFDWVGEFEAEIKSWGSKLKDDVRKELDEGRAPMLAETVERMTRAAKAMQDMAEELKKMLPSLAPIPPAMGQLHELKPAPFIPTSAASM